MRELFYVSSYFKYLWEIYRLIYLTNTVGCRE